MVKMFPGAADEAATLSESWGDAAIRAAQERLHAAMAKDDASSVAYAMTVCRMLLAQRRIAG